MKKPKLRRHAARRKKPLRADRKHAQPVMIIRPGPRWAEFEPLLTEFSDAQRHGDIEACERLHREFNARLA
jgi:hypothetical protein